METNQAKIGFQQISKDQGSETTINIWKFDQELSRKALAKMIIYLLILSKVKDLGTL